MTETDHSWEALVAVTHANVSEERGALNRSLAQIRGQMPDVEDVELAKEIRYRAQMYLDVWPSMALTATALAKHWERLPVEHRRTLDHRVDVIEQDPRRQRRRTNVQYFSGCAVCVGQGIVTIGWRPANHPTSPEEPGHEQTARCPQCNRDSWWEGKTWAYGPREGEVVVRG